MQQSYIAVSALTAVLVLLLVEIDLSLRHTSVAACWSSHHLSPLGRTPGGLLVTLAAVVRQRNAVGGR